VRVSKSIPRRGFKRFLMPPSYSSDKKTTSAKKSKDCLTLAPLLMATTKELRKEIPKYLNLHMKLGG
jgi:hypothetical protein